MSHVTFISFFPLFCGGASVVNLDGGGFVINGADTVLLHKGNVWRGKYACIWTLSKKGEVERVGGDRTLI